MTQRNHGFAFTNGIRMHYVEQGDGPLVVLCHGWPESWYSWRHQLPALAQSGFRAVAPDQRGYGQTDRPEPVAAYNVIDLVADVTGLVRALGEEQAVVIGHDLGSIVAATCALLRPDMVRAVGLLSVPYLPRRPIRPRAQWELATQTTHFYHAYFQEPGKVEAELEEDVRRALLGIYYSASADAPPGTTIGTFDKTRRFVDNLTVPDAPPEWLTEEDLSFYVGEFERAGFRGGINWYRNLDRNWELTPFLDGARITRPALFAAGARDGVLTLAREEYETLERNVPNLARKELVPGGGHWIQQERPDELNGLLIEFLHKL